MLKNLTRLEQVIGGKIYHFTCDIDSKLEDAKEALVQFMGYVVQVETAAKAKQAPAPAQPEPAQEQPVAQEPPQAAQ
jgi:hypothetical protein